MIKVAHVVASFDVGGLQKGVVNVVNRSDATMFRHLVVSFSDEVSMGGRLQRGDVTSLGVAPGSRRPLAEPLAEVLRGFGPDVVHTRNWPTLWDGVRARKRARVPAHVHGYHGRDATGATGFGWKRRWLGRWLNRGLNRVITLTRQMGVEYVRDFGRPRGGLEIVPNGVELPGDRARFRSEEDPLVVLAVGRLDPVKDYGSLLRAFGAMAGRQDRDRLIIVGDGPLRAALASDAAALGLGDALELPGLLDRSGVLEAYDRADVFVQSSLYEGMSNTLVEAMAAGLPVVATAVGGNPDVVGSAGHLYPAGDPSALAAILADLRAHPARAAEAGQGARSRVEQEYSFDRMVSGYESVYRDVAGRN